MPNNNYVKREDIFPAVTEIAKEIVFGNQDDDKVVDIINSIPAADVEPVRHGRWISMPGKKDRICSRCNADEPYKPADENADVYGFCPHCGAKMDAEPPKGEDKGTENIE